MQEQRWDSAFEKLQEVFECADDQIASEFSCKLSNLDLLEKGAVEKLRHQVQPLSKAYYQQTSNYATHFKYLTTLASKQSPNRRKDRISRIGPQEFFLQSRLHPILNNAYESREFSFNVFYRSVSEIFMPYSPSPSSQPIFSTLGYQPIVRDLSNFKEEGLVNVFSDETRRIHSPTISAPALHPQTNEIFFCCPLNSTIQVLTSDRKNIYAIDVSAQTKYQMNYLSHISFSPDGSICALTLCSQHCVLLFSCGFNSSMTMQTELSFLRSIGRLGNKPSDFAYPEAAVFSNSGEFLYVADRNNEVVQKFTLDGKFVLEIGTRNRRQGFGPVVGLVNVGDNYIGALVNRYKTFLLISTKSDTIVKQWTLPHIDGGHMHISPGPNQGFILVCSTGSRCSLLISSKKNAAHLVPFSKSLYFYALFDLENRLYFVPQRLRDLRAF
eukprot:TRINITY_DN2473_c0_g1_i2.p1 TRINITY_DN2473_c0_g1~~TRINITY_DN2473_c0_g1_i2.p1  ORF type:complete len:440 (+),score=71.30 TRINITY_DN2473_c0_g1_i2:43-1362(+)